jgi:hypothetical protein
LCGKLLEETRREENNSQHEALLITKARKKYFGTYYKGSRMASKRRPNAKLQPHESPRRRNTHHRFRKLDKPLVNTIQEEPKNEELLIASEMFKVVVMFLNMKQEDPSWYLDLVTPQACLRLQL